MLETDRTTTLDPQARLAVLLATTGLTQLDLAKLLGVASRTVRRWMQGVCTPPAVAIKELEVLARTLDEAADSVVRGMGEHDGLMRTEPNDLPGANIIHEFHAGRIAG